MIDKEDPSDSAMVMDDKPTEEPPPYSRRQASTSRTTQMRRLSRSRNSPTNGRFVAPIPEPVLVPPHTPQLVLSPPESNNMSGSSTPMYTQRAQGSFVDLAVEKPKMAPAGYGDYEGYTGSPVMGHPSAAGSSFSGPGTSTGSGSIVVGPRTPTAITRKGVDTLVMMGAGENGMWLNHVVVVNKGELIQGTYHIDPNLDIPDHATPRRALHLSKKAHSRSTSSLATPGKSGKQKADSAWHPTTSPELCNAIFETKNGNVDISLSIGGTGSSKASKANVDVKAKQGRVTIRVTEIVEGRRLNLDVATGKGDIEVFLPRNFSGPLHVHTEGEITLLPGLASAMEIISAREDDALVMVSPAKVPPSPAASSSLHQNHSHRSIPGALSQWLHPGGEPMAQSYQGDFANLVSASGGNVKVGFIDENKVKEESPGVWKKLVQMFTGRSNSA